MKVTVIGKKRSAGDFIDRETKQQVVYDNTHLYCIAKDSDVEGTYCIDLKCKTAVVEEAGINVGDTIVADVDNKYQKYGKVYSVDVVKKGESK